MGRYYYNNKLVDAVTITAATTTTYDIAESGGNFDSVTVYANFTYGSGGTSCIVYLEGSYDGGSTWTDVAAVGFTTASDVKVVNVVRGTTATVLDADATLTVNTAVSHIPPRLRLAVTSSGTYGGSTTLNAWFWGVGQK